MKKLLKHKSLLLLSLVILLASFLRLYRIGDYMTFLGDEGRDMLVVKHILEGDLVFIGPRSSAADFFYGPIYYYFITPFLWLFRYDPVGPSVFVAFTGIGAVFLVYYIGKKFFSETAGLFAAALFSVSPIVLTYSRSSWNPNPLPFITLLLLYSVYKAVEKYSLKLFFLTGILCGIAIQLHYITIFLDAAVFFFILTGTIYVQKKFDIVRLLKSYLALAGGFATGLSLFLAFEIKNNFPNTRTIINFIFFGTAQESNKIIPLFQNIPEVFFRLFGRLMLRFPPTDQLDKLDKNLLFTWQAATILMGIIAFFAITRMKNKLQMLLIVMWVFFGILLFGFYRKEVYEYFLGFLFPFPFLLIGYALAMLYDSKKLKVFGKAISLLLFLSLFLYNISGVPFRYPANKQKDQVKGIADYVLSKTDGKPFNFALIARGNSDHGYRYFFELANNEPIVIENPELDPERKTITDQLFVVCEDPNCSPLGYPLWEVAGFGRAEIAGEWPVSVVKVYKLIHYKEK